MLSGIFLWSAAGLADLQEDVGIYLGRPQRGGRVRREEWVPRAGAKDDDAAALQVPDRPPPDVRLRDLPHLDGRQDPCLRPQRVQR